MKAQANISNQERIMPIEVKYLFLDPENPRLALDGNKLSENDLILKLYKIYSLEDLLTSLSQHGYFTEEPLIAVQRNKNVQKEKTYTVVEGNRRLAALKLLLFEEIRQVVGAKKISDIDGKIRGKLDPVPVKIYSSRKEIVPYLGVRHITGVKPWTSQAKAKYIYYLANQGHKIREIKKMVASRGDVVPRHLLTLYLINQANEISDKTWEEEARGFNFSLLYTAIGYASIRQCLKISSSANQEPKPSPVPESYKSELISLMTEIYGSPDYKKPARITESRQIKLLAAVYENKEILDEFKSGLPLEQAFRKSGGEEAMLIDTLREASINLDDANSIAPHHKKNQGAIRWAIRCQETIEELINTLRG